MHISFLADCLDNQRAGVHVYAKNLIQEILKQAPENRYSFVHKTENPFFEGLESYAIPRKKAPGYNSYRKFVLIPRLLRKLKPDIVVEMMHIGPFRTPPGAKRAVIIHDITPVLFPKFHISRSTIIHRLLLKRVVKNADHIIVPSKNTAQDIRNRYQTEADFSVIHPGIREHRAIKEKREISEPYLLYLGTIEPRKNLKILIETFLKLKSEQKIPHKLVLAGEIGWKTEDILPITEHPDIVVTGYVSAEKKANLLKNAEIFIYPSIYEGFGIPPLEAMQYGIPVICSSGGSLSEIFGQNAIIFDPREPKMLEMAIEQLLKNPQLRAELGKKGRQFSQRFTWEKSAQKALQAFQKMAKNGTIIG